MQERRNTIRMSHRCRTQYCPSDDLLPRDGQLLNVSMRGAGLLVREPCQPGERITLSFPLPDGPDPVTATGLVRWSDRTSRAPKGYPLGIEWLPLEERVRQRLQAFRPQGSQARTPRVYAHPLFIAGAVVGMVVIGCWVASQMFLLHKAKRQLSAGLAQRDQLISRLQQRDQRMRGALATAVTRLAETEREVTRLDQQAAVLSGNIARLRSDVERFHDSSVDLRAERERLMQQVLVLEQERLTREREAFALAYERQQLAQIIAQQQERLSTRAWGNRGYIIQEGQSTSSGLPMSIRVYDPELSSR